MMSILSITGKAIGMLAMKPITMPCIHQDILKALIPIVKPIRPLLKTIVSLSEVDSDSVASGFELAKSMHTIPNTKPHTVAIKTLFDVNNFFSL